MSGAQFRRIARLEVSLQQKLAKAAKSHEPLKTSCFAHVASLCTLFLEADPKIDERLDEAWPRCLDSETWKAWLDEHRHSDGFKCRGHCDPFTERGAMHVAEHFQKHVLPNLPGANEKEKLDAILQTIPPWLLWFTGVDVKAAVLGFEPSNVSSMSSFERSPLSYMGLPRGRFERRPWPAGEKDLFYEARKARKVTEREYKLPDNLTDRERAAD
jgi:hypothetical protein